MKPKETLYLCDRKACEKCSPECKHTIDISHAENFEKGPDGSFLEKQRLLAILRPTIRLKDDQMKKIRDDIDAQMRTGLIVVPTYMDVVYPKDVSRKERKCTDTL